MKRGGSTTRAPDPEPPRTYSRGEHAAFRAVSGREWGETYEPTRGPAQHAAGPYWPAELRRRASRMERLIPLYRLAADALEREISTDPRCKASDTEESSDA